jgi:hypothetical protein
MILSYFVHPRALGLKLHVPVSLDPGKRAKFIVSLFDPSLQELVNVYCKFGVGARTFIGSEESLSGARKRAS